MPWVAVLMVTLWADVATSVQQPALLALFLVTLGLAMWCSWSDDKARRPRP
jgi:hypothetical protein